MLTTLENSMNPSLPELSLPTIPISLNYCSMMVERRVNNYKDKPFSYNHLCYANNDHKIAIISYQTEQVETTN